MLPRLKTAPCVFKLMKCLRNKRTLPPFAKRYYCLFFMFGRLVVMQYRDGVDAVQKTSAIMSLEHYRRLYLMDHDTPDWAQNFFSWSTFQGANLFEYYQEFCAKAPARWYSMIQTIPYYPHVARNFYYLGEAIYKHPKISLATIDSSAVLLKMFHCVTALTTMIDAEKVKNSAAYVKEWHMSPQELRDAHHIWCWNPAMPPLLPFTCQKSPQEEVTEKLIFSLECQDRWRAAVSKQAKAELKNIRELKTEANKKKKTKKRTMVPEKTWAEKQENHSSASQKKKEVLYPCAYSKCHRTTKEIYHGERYVHYQCHSRCELHYHYACWRKIAKRGNTRMCEHEQKRVKSINENGVKHILMYSPRIVSS